MLSPELLILFVLLALLAEILGTVGGFGSSLFFVPIAGYFMDFQSVLGVTALFHVASNLSKIALFKHGFNRFLIIYMGIPAVVFVIAGAIMSKYFQTYMLELMLSIFLIALSSFLMIMKNVKVEPGKQNSIAGGIISGFIAGLVGTGGAVRGIVLSSYQLKIEVFIATSAIIDLAIDASRSVVYYYNGYIHSKDLYLVFLLIAVSFIGTYIGRFFLRYITESYFRNIVLSLALITGIVTLIRLATAS